MIWQTEIFLPPFRRGVHLITREIEKKLTELPETGLIHLFLKHTSAGLLLNENADPSVRGDFDRYLDHLFPENHPLYEHNDEGPDDMPAHLKSGITGQSLTIPITHHRLNLGTWQGIYLCEFRKYGGNRRLVLTVYG
jgi:secondary thiamine-phosphate synthase enzyme